MRKIKNPPAFPSTHNGSTLPNSAGLTMRDYFAGLAMQGFAADPTLCWDDGVAGMAKAAYKWADAILVERENK
jgi:hypothetical protein